MVKLRSVVRVFCVLEYDGKFVMPSYFLCALYIHSNNAQYLKIFTIYINIISNPYGINFSRSGLIY